MVVALDEEEKVTDMDEEQLKRKLEEIENVNFALSIISQTISDINNTCITDTVLEFSEAHTKGLNKAMGQLCEFQSEKLDTLISFINKEKENEEDFLIDEEKITDIELKEKYVL